jgi:hypothetical protein
MVLGQVERMFQRLGNQRVPLLCGPSSVTLRTARDGRPLKREGLEDRHDAGSHVDSAGYVHSSWLDHSGLLKRFDDNLAAVTLRQALCNCRQ